MKGIEELFDETLVFTLIVNGIEFHVLGAKHGTWYADYQDKRNILHTIEAPSYEMLRTKIVYNSIDIDP